jgi:hypothetical protein
MTSIYGVAGEASPFLEFMYQWFPRLAEGQAIFSVDVVWMHLNFNRFPDETIHVSSFC